MRQILLPLLFCILVGAALSGPSKGRSHKHKHKHGLHRSRPVASSTHKKPHDDAKAAVTPAPQTKTPVKTPTKTPTAKNVTKKHEEKKKKDTHLAQLIAEYKQCDKKEAGDGYGQPSAVKIYDRDYQQFINKVIRNFGYSNMVALYKYREKKEGKKNEYLFKILDLDMNSWFIVSATTNKNYSIKPEKPFDARLHPRDVIVQSMVRIFSTHCLLNPSKVKVPEGDDPLWEVQMMTWPIWNRDKWDHAVWGPQMTRPETNHHDDAALWEHLFGDSEVTGDSGNHGSRPSDNQREPKFQAPNGEVIDWNHPELKDLRPVTSTYNNHYRQVKAGKKAEEHADEEESKIKAAIEAQLKNMEKDKPADIEFEETKEVEYPKDQETRGYNWHEPKRGGHNSWDQAQWGGHGSHEPHWGDSGFGGSSWGGSNWGEPNWGGSSSHGSNWGSPSSQKPNWGGSNWNEPNWGSSSSHEPNWGASNWNEPNWGVSSWDQHQQASNNQWGEPQWGSSNSWGQQGGHSGLSSHGTGWDSQGYGQPQVVKTTDELMMMLEHEKKHQKQHSVAAHQRKPGKKTKPDLGKHSNKHHGLSN